jgi:phage tail-like protein
VSSYLQYLPAVLQQGEFLGRFLLAFEEILSGGLDLSQIDTAGLSAEEKARLETEKRLLGFEQILDRIHTFFDPAQAPEDFLPWLAQWVATSLRDDWSVETRRRFVGQIVPLYRMRGTRAGIQAVLELSGEVVKVVDFGDGLDEELEVREFGSGPWPPHFFGVLLTVQQRDPIELARKVRRVRAIVEREKPAHTVYALRINYPAMRINNDPATNKALGPGVLVGRNTVLGTVKV